MTIVTVLLPRAGRDEIVVQVLGCTLCGSDLHSFHGRRIVETPMILGHEIVGRIVEIGAEASHVAMDGKPLRVGDRVCWALIANCGECYYCTHDLPQKCAQAIKYGHHAFASDRDLTGGMAEHCILGPRTQILRVPDSLPLELACPASCSTATIAAAIESIESMRPHSVVILGAGMLGLTACAFARDLGATTIVCVDRSAERREQALQFGASHSADLASTRTLVHELTSQRGVDCVLECTGANEAFATGLDTLRLGGRMVAIGAVFPESPFPIVIERVVRRNLSIVGIHNYQPRHLQRAIEFLASSGMKYPFAQLVDRWYDLNEYQQAIEHASDGQTIRVGIRPAEL